MRIILSRLELLAAMMFASSDDVRFTLNSICVEVSAGARPLLISTDGRRLAVIESQAEQIEEFDAAFQMLLRADFVRPICALSKAFGGKLFPWIQFECKPGSARVQVTFIGGKCFFEAEENALVEGAFPNWRGCVPPKNSVRTPMNDLGINSEFMGDFARAGKILNAPTKMIQLNLVGAESAIEVKIPGVEWFYALVMPCKVDETVDYQPEFLGIVTDLPVRIEKGGTPNAEHSTLNAEGETGLSVGGDTPTATSVTFTADDFPKLSELAQQLKKFKPGSAEGDNSEIKISSPSAGVATSDCPQQGDEPVESIKRPSNSSVSGRPKSRDGIASHIGDRTTPAGVDNGAGGEGSSCDEDEELIQQCIEVIRSEQKASVSLLQRRLRLGYRTANKIMYELERRGIVGPSKGSEPRDILIDLQPSGKA